ncbi:hypothetical protein [Formosa algae]|nr:hypothetical protein [Formosa algae]OEI78754.1 hypothetical protein AST99_17940 [Formosa algae]PNW28721.1 hypothetical protein BKP44_07335 [Formosa algae]
MRKRIILLLISMIFITQLKAQSSEKEITTEFLRIFETEPMKAMDYAFSTNTWMERNIDGIESLKTKFKDILPLIGDYYGYEVITEKSVGNNLKLISFMLKYDRQPVRFTFVLYKPNDKWQVQNLNWDVDIDDELEESAKLNHN